MNKRTLSIIKEMSNLERTITLEKLSKKFDVSSRTIRNDLNTIGGVLKEYDLSPLKILRGGEIYRELDFVKLQEYLSFEDFYEYKLSKEERVKIAAVMMVQASDYITLGTIAESLYVSRATVIEDLPDVKAMIQRNNMEVISSPNKGQLVLGKESDKRMFLLRLREKEKNAASNKQVMSVINVQAGNQITIQKIINEQEKIHKNYLDDPSFTKIQTYLGIMIDRNMQGEYIEPQPMFESEKYLVAQDVLRYVSQYCNITTTENEINFFAKLLTSCHYVKKSSHDQEIIKIQMITRRFIKNISEELEVNLNMDYDFFENLSNHLESVLINKNMNFPDNEVIREIVAENQRVHQVVKNNLDMLYQYTDREFAEIEIMYITVHICAALERRKNQNFVMHVVVVCHAGVGTSQLLMEKLKKHFNFQIVDVMPAHKAIEVTPDRADLIISTVPLKHVQIDHVVVSPMFSDEDYIRVGAKLDAVRSSRNLPDRVEEKEISAKGMLKVLRPIIYSALNNQDVAEGLYLEIRSAVRDYFNQTEEEEEALFAPYLHHLLTADHIQLDVPCTDRYDAIRKSAQPLLDAGYIENRYVDAIITNLEDNGPYFVLVPGFAVPHEGLDTGSIHLGMNLILLEKPIEFGADDYDPVEFVCCLSAVDYKTHLKAFFNLVNMLSNTDFKAALLKAKTPQEAAKIIEHYEYTIALEK